MLYIVVQIFLLYNLFNKMNISMNYFSEILSKSQLKKTFRNLAFSNHPDLGGKTSVMQKINEEYMFLNKSLNKIPDMLTEVCVGNRIFVNESTCIVTEVDGNLFKAKALISKREAYFDKESGFGLFNFKIRAHVIQ